MTIPARGEQRETVNGKPHFGLLFGSCAVFHEFVQEPWQEDPKIKDMVERLTHLPSLIGELEIRNSTIIYRPPYFGDDCNQKATLAHKYMVWGRAFQVMRLIKTGKNKKYRKAWVCGRRKKR